MLFIFTPFPFVASFLFVVKYVYNKQSSFGFDSFLSLKDYIKNRHKCRLYNIENFISAAFKLNCFAYFRYISKYSNEVSNAKKITKLKKGRNAAVNVITRKK